MTHVQSRGRLQFLLLAALFFAPLLAAVLFYFVFPDWQPDARTNYGELVAPARPLPDAPLRDARGTPVAAEELRGRWSYVYVAGAECDAACADKLHQIRQIRTLLNEKRQRVQRVYVAPDPEASAAAAALLAADHPDLKVYADTPEAAYRRFFGPRDPQALYLVDPLGNWLMVYDGQAESKGILKDIKKLLRVSQIG
ncbi:SCO family protein [Sinimarinibacterium flocculans]|uniref:SCO family protein n=1 Tax=Sinimarinibacterium flocculans TaxID=985250 RepID=UPI00351487EC